MFFGVWLFGGKKKGKVVRVSNGLLSHAVAHILPSTLVALTAGFEMGPGVPPPLESLTTNHFNTQI